MQRITLLFARLTALFCLAASLHSENLPSLPDGLYLHFETTLGPITCQLEYQQAPRTVANIVGLTEGTQPWLDIPEAVIRKTPFFDGIIFHRVATNFVIQAGSPNQKGTDGPGYSFQDEFHPELRHSSAGILSMANAGPNSNGSQFFITLAPTPWLDDKHSVFGSVVLGMETVMDIGQTPLQPGSQVPIVPVVIVSARIHRVGDEALAFRQDQVTPPLPTVQAIASTLELDAQGNLFLTWEGATKNYLHHILLTSDFNRWSPQRFFNLTEPRLNATSLKNQIPFQFMTVFGSAPDDSVPQE